MSEAEADVEEKETLQVAIAKYGKEKGYALILQKEFTLTSESHSWKSVLYHAEEIDLTHEILTLLNES